MQQFTKRPVLVALALAASLGTVFAQTQQTQTQSTQTSQPAAPAQSAPASAVQAQAEYVRVVTTQARIVTVQEEGRTVERVQNLPNNASANPRDIIQQTVTVNNLINRPLTGVNIDLPVPNGMVFVNAASNLAGVRTEFSFDGGKTFGAAPLKRRVTVTENGQQVTREVVVPPSEYTNVRWMVAEMPARGEAKMALRVRVR